MNIYRLYPTLWNDGTNMMAVTIYAIDRAPPPPIQTSYSRRPTEDPSYYWLGQTFQRILPTDNSSNCVTWAQLPAWLSFATSQGYTVQGDLGKLKPFSDIYITGP